MSQPGSDTPTREELEAALRRLVDALGGLPANNLDQASERAYRDAHNLLDPDEFTERFMAQGGKK